MEEKYIQVGVTAMRDPVTREFLPAVPLYIKATDAARADEQTLLEDLGKLFAERMRHYVDGNHAAGLSL